MAVRKTREFALLRRRREGGRRRKECVARSKSIRISLSAGGEIFYITCG